MCFPPLCSSLGLIVPCLSLARQAVSSSGGSTSLSCSDNYFSRCQSLKFSSYCQLLPVNSKDDDWFCIVLGLYLNSFFKIERSINK